MFDKRRGFWKLGLGLLVGGLCACDQQSTKTGVDFQSQGFEGFDSTHFNLLSAPCTKATASGVETVTLTIADGEMAYIFYRTTDSQVVANANNSLGTECVFPAADKISILAAAAGNGSDHSHKVLFDFLSGPFAMGTSTGNTTGLTGNGISVNLGVLSSTVGPNTVEIRGTNGQDLFTFGTAASGSPLLSYASFSFQTTTTSGTTVTVVAPVTHAYTDMVMSGVSNILVSTGPSDDIITGQGVLPSPANTLVPLSGNISFVVYGGDGNDAITSGGAGSGVNQLYGGAGNDKFVQQAALAHDIISGGTDLPFTFTATGTNTSTQTGTTHLTGTGTGTSTAVRTINLPVTVTNTNTQTDLSIDVVDYSARTASLHITLGDEAVAVAASSKITCVGKSMISDHDGFTINDGTNAAQAYEYQKNVDAVTTGSIVFPAQVALADHDTFTINDGVNSAIFEIMVTTATPSSSDSNLVVHVDSVSAAHDVALAAAAAIALYQTEQSADLTKTLNVTVTPPGAALSPTEATLAIANINPDVVTPFIAQSGTDLTIVNTPGHYWVPTASTIGINISTTYTKDTEVATATLAAIVPGTLMNVSASGSVITVSLKAAGSKPSFTITKNAGNFVVNNISTGAAAPGRNDGNTGELDSILADVERVIGGSGDDYIDATNASLISHTLEGMAGNDTLICGDPSSTVPNTLYGGPGDDILQGGYGADTLYGGGGNDTLRGGPGNDLIDGENLQCIVAAAATSTKAAVYGSALCTSTFSAAATTAGRNTLDYSDRTLPVTVNMKTMGADLVVGESGEKDTVVACINLRGGSGSDTLTGDDAANMIWGGPGDDIINGGKGNDSLYGEMGDDTVSGNEGDDYVYGGVGVNTLYGDTNGDATVVGNDLVDNSQGTLGVVDCGPGDMDILISGGHETSALNCEM